MRAERSEKTQRVFNGLGVKQDYKRVIDLLEICSTKGHMHASNKLALLYRHGYSIKKNLLVAYDLYHLADNQTKMSSFNQEYIEELHNNRKICIQYVLWNDLNVDICNIIADYVNHK